MFSLQEKVLRISPLNPFVTIGKTKVFLFIRKKFSAKLAETVHRSFSIKMVSDGISKMFEIRIRDMPWSRRGPHKIE
jgi:hypothetical protein